MRKYFQCLAIIGAMTACGFSDDTLSLSTKSKNAMQTLERIMAKAGISFDGEFRSQFFAAQATGSAVNKLKRSNETVENTLVDFDIKARPNTVTQGRLIFRMQQDWRNFFSDISNPIFTRWLSIDGSVKGMFSYNVGNFRQKFTPLTLYTPDIDILYEPDIFAEQRTIAKNEVFLEDNNRLFQGVNLNFGAEVYPIFNSFKVTALAVRLRNVETSNDNGNKVTAGIEMSEIEKFMAGGNTDMTFLKGLSVGGSFLDIFDNKLSYHGSDTDAAVKAQNTTIGDFRGAIDVDKLTGAKNWRLGVSAEMALSSDDSAFYDTVGRQAIIASGTTPPLNLAHQSITGNALHAGLNAGYTLPEIFNVTLDLGFINNTSNYRNELAQTPSFIGRRIMNVENDGMSSLVSTTLPLYSTFDALYNQVFKFAPSIGNPGWWYKEPFSKNSYNPMVFNKSELSKLKYNEHFISQYLDPSVQLVMPFGPATPNRTGINANATLGFLNDQLQAKVLFASLKEIDQDTTMVTTGTTTSAMALPKTTYSQVGGGIKGELSKFIGWKYPFNLSVGVVSSKASNDGIAGVLTMPAGSITSNFLTGNLYFKFWKRTALLFGLESITNDYKADSTFTQKQMLGAIGLEYKVGDGAYVTGTFGQIDVKHTGNPTVVTSNKTTANSNQKLVNVLLRVMF